eukprot:scaffold27953_cov19-Tisochrysis_lutea.AAC.2
MERCVQKIGGGGLTKGQLQNGGIQSPKHHPALLHDDSDTKEMPLSCQGGYAKPVGKMPLKLGRRLHNEGAERASNIILDGKEGEQ